MMVNSSCTTVLTLFLFSLILRMSSCLEVYVTVGSDCDDVPNMPVYYACSNDKEVSDRILLRCCTDRPPCIEWTSEWWYKNAAESDSDYKKYPQIEHSKTAWVYVNNTYYPIRYLCNITSMYGCEAAGSGYIDVQRGLPPRISIVNITGETINITTETTKVSLYFEILTYPPLTSDPKLTVNDTDLSSKWKIIYRSVNMNRITHLTKWSHFFIEITTEDFMKEDNGDYTVFVNNTCSLSSKTVIIKVVCKDIITILPVSLENNHHYHTVEGNEVTFSYKCTGNNVINWWGVGGYPISSLTYAFNKTSSSVDCVNTLNLTLHNVTLDYSGNYTAYPSTSEHFSTSGINVTAHLSVHKCPKLLKTFDVQVFNDTAHLGCSFIASNYNYAHFVQSEWSKDYSSIMPTSRFEFPSLTWEEKDHVITKLIIKSVTPDDSGTYFCSISYNTDVIKEQVRSDHGEIVLHIGSNNEGTKSKKDLIIASSSAGVGLLLVILIIGGLIILVLYKKVYHHRRPYVQLPMSETTNDTGDGTHGSITSRASQESANGSENINSRSYQD